MGSDIVVAHNVPCCVSVLRGNCLLWGWVLTIDGLRHIRDYQNVRTRLGTSDCPKLKQRFAWLEALLTVGKQPYHNATSVSMMV